MIENKIKIGDLEINYKIIGEASLSSERQFLILHGWGSKSGRWLTTAKLLNGQKGIKIIIPDLPGFGQSDKPKEIWGLEEYSEFIEKFAKTLGLKNFYLLGHSFGGALAVKYGLKYGFNLKKLILISAACFRKQDLKKKSLYSFSKYFKFLSHIPLLRKFFYKFVVKSDYPSTNGVMRNIYLKVIGQDLSSELKKVNVETLIVWGEKDDITPLDQGRTINSEIKNSVLEIIPRTGHDLNADCPGMVADVIAKNI